MTKTGKTFLVIFLPIHTWYIFKILNPWCVKKRVPGYFDRPRSRFIQFHIFPFRNDVMSMFLFLAIVGLANAQYLHLHENLKRGKHSGPLKITKDPLQSASNRTRSKRSWGDETHDSTDPNDITVSVFKLAKDSHNVAYVEWGGTDNKSPTILVLTRDSSNPPTYVKYLANRIYY